MQRTIPTNLFLIAQKYMGRKELPGEDKNAPFIMEMLTLDNSWPQNDETPWCSAFINFLCGIVDIPRTKSLMARSWLGIGMPIDLENAEVGFDVCIFKRGSGKQPGADVLNAPGHVALFAGVAGNKIYVLGGNQGDSVSMRGYPKSRLLGVRRLI